MKKQVKEGSLFDILVGFWRDSDEQSEELLLNTGEDQKGISKLKDSIRRLNELEKMHAIVPEKNEVTKGTRESKIVESKPSSAGQKQKNSSKDKEIDR